MKVVGVVNVKGGAGKTQAVVHLAWEARGRCRVGVVDLDPTHQSVNWIGGAALGMDAVALNMRESSLEDYVAQLRALGEHDLLLIDTPANDLNAALETLMVSDLVIVPVGAGTSDLGMLATTERQIRRAQSVRAAEGRPPLDVRALVNRAGFAPSVAGRTTEAVGAFGMSVFRQQIPLRGAYQEATGNRITAAQHHYAAVLEEIFHA